MFKTPILFLIFNRPDTTQKVFESIKKQKPKYLYIAADGPRSNNNEDRQNCEIVRDIVKQIDWECELKTLFQTKNLGCGKAVSSAITWFFENVEQGIILEDDCLPHIDFFYYCEELLNKYKDDTDILSISGSNFLKGIKRGQTSYYFSSHFHVWGWASWRRAWNKYDYEALYMTEEMLNTKLDKRFITTGEKKLFKSLFRDMKAHKVDSWDYQWLFAHLFQEGLTVIPNVNLITNIGFDGTHFINNHENQLINLPTSTIFPWVLNKNKEVDKKADLLLYKLNFKHNDIEQLFKKIIKTVLHFYKKAFRLILKVLHFSKIDKIIKSVFGIHVELSFIVPNGLMIGTSNKLNNLNLTIRKYDKNRDYYMKVGNSCIISGNFIFETSTGRITIGNNTFIGGSMFVCVNEIKIGNDVMISWGCTIVDNNAHSLDSKERALDMREAHKGLHEGKVGFYKDWTLVKNAPIEIKDNAWIGFNSIILKGVTIGEGAIVGSGSVVTKDVPNYAIVAGNPARIIKYTK